MRGTITQLERELRNRLATALKQGRTLAELGRQSGISPGQLSRFHRHVRQIHLPTAGLLAEALGLVLQPER